MKAAWGQWAIGAMLGAAVLWFASLHDFHGTRLATTGRVALAGVALAAWIVHAWRASRRAADTPMASPGADTILVVHASQTGFATELAERTADTLRAAGKMVDLLPIWGVDAARLKATTHALFVASTTGEGDAPDVATGFRRDLMASRPVLDGLTYAVLALGDRDYEDFCAFGHELDRWLRESGATSWFDLVEVDNGDEGALRHWQGQLARSAGASDTPDWSRPAYGRWTLSERALLNPGSVGRPCFHLALVPENAAALSWKAGDIVEIGPRKARGDETPLPHREYSIASIPEDGALHLVVRQTVSENGHLGIGSGWLTSLAAVGDTIDLRIRSNPGFHAPDDDRPMLLIGNGTGIAGLRALLKTRIACGHRRNWLVYGERHVDVDRLHMDDVERWHRAGDIERVDFAWSRQSSKIRYVQDILRAHADDIRRFVAEGASLYVCGSLTGMAPGVDAALRDILGDARVEDLMTTTHYRRDVY
ncbi:MAG: Sulfite reductase [NADPH] flavoprotein alpha-component [Luteibacter sp.]|uniref:sulfite reductase subunit alpha n=1 Tax=Luteibacter sp. TaxID=1886636 RepID=UPI0013832715|nr:sulfite reductase subunit alpha [Luteibacter sp.]KAF1005281.1 MAG: Sulfite reductase [NADPH] flavoprotein alpha-component [Luteibacter sp.]